MKKKIAIDFDGTLIDGDGIPRKINISTGKPKKEAAAAIKFLQDLGYECYVLTSRKEIEWGMIKSWLREHGFPEMEVTNIKSPSVVYIDDRGMRFKDNWQDICRYFG